MSLNPFINPRKHALGIFAPIRVRFVIRSERHVVEPIWSVWIRISEWPTVIRALLHVNEFVRRMVVNVAGDRLPVVDRSAPLPAVPERIANVIRFVNCCPKLIRTRDKREPFGIADPAGQDFPILAIEVVLVDSTANRIAPGIFRICIRRGGNINIEFVVRTNNEIFQLMAVGSVQLGTAAVWQIGYDHRLLACARGARRNEEAADLIRFANIEVQPIFAQRVFEKSRFCHISPTVFPHSSFQTAGANPGPRTVSI